MTRLEPVLKNGRRSGLRQTEVLDAVLAATRRRDEGVRVAALLGLLRQAKVASAENDLWFQDSRPRAGPCVAGPERFRSGPDGPVRLTSQWMVSSVSERAEFR